MAKKKSFRSFLIIISCSNCKEGAFLCSFFLHLYLIIKFMTTYNDDVYNNVLVYNFIKYFPVSISIKMSISCSIFIICRFRRKIFTTLKLVCFFVQSSFVGKNLLWFGWFRLCFWYKKCHKRQHILYRLEFWTYFHKYRHWPFSSILEIILTLRNFSSQSIRVL